MKTSITEKLTEAEELFSGYEITGRELSRVRKLRQRLENQKMTVSVIGQFKRGKSALVNGILGDKILPVGIVPVTAVVTTVEYGEKSAAVHFANGMVEETAFEEIHTYVNEQENRDNHLNVTRVAIKCPAEFLKGGITFVDTPGVGSMHEKNSEEAYAFVKESDAVIFTLSVDSPINQIEIEFLKNAREHAAKFYFAVNKIDVIDEDELEAYTEYCRSFIKELMDTDEVMLFPVSAKKGIGIEALKDAITKDCVAQSREILEESAELKLHDIVVNALSQITLYRNALSMPGDEFDKRFEEIKGFFKDVWEKTAAMPEEMKANKIVAEAHLNDVKNNLAAKVKELFGIEYHYDIYDVKGEDGLSCGETRLEDRVASLCDSLNHTLSTVFMYREENAYKVVRRINDLNRLVRRLVKMRNDKK